MAFSFKQSNKAIQNGFDTDKNQNSPMLVHYGYYSPDETPFKNSSKLTPKSILKDSLGSGSKAKKNIIINETLNETRKFSHRNESNGDKNSIVTLSPEQSNSIQKERPKTAVAPSSQFYEYYNDQSGMTGLAFMISENDSYNQVSKLAFYPEDQIKRTISNEVNIKDELTGFQKAYIKRLQREREQAKYYELLKKQNEMLSKNNENNKPNLLEERDKNSRERVNVEEIKNSPFNTPLIRKKGRSHRSTDNNNNLPSPSLNQIENKISLLQQTLDMYSQKLQASIAKQKGQSDKEEKLLNGGPGIKNTSTIEIENNKTISLISREAESNSISSEEKDIYPIYREKDNRKEETVSRKNGESGLKMNNYKLSEEKINDASKKKQSINNKVEKLRAELEEFWLNDFLNFKRRNQSLKSKIKVIEETCNKEIMSKQNFKKNTTADEIFEKERELLKTIDQIRGKLKKSLSKKSIKEINNENTLKSPSKSMTRSYTPNKGSTQSRCLQKELQNKIEDVRTLNTHQLRRAYGTEKLKMENSHILNQGLSSTYNGFNWNTDQSLKINKNI